MQSGLEIFETGKINDGNSGCSNETDDSSLQTTISCTIGGWFSEKDRPVWSSARRCYIRRVEAASESRKTMFSSKMSLSFLSNGSQMVERGIIKADNLAIANL